MRDTYGFKSEYKPNPVPELEAFEKEFLDIPKKLKFKKPKQDKFREDLQNIMEEIRDSKDVIVHADKTRNVYKIPVSDYNDLLLKEITKEYRKTTENDVKDVNKQTANIARKLELEGRMEIFTEAESYITIKDHKESFPRKVATRLINPCKTDLGKVAKIVLQRVILELQSVIGVNQWRSSSSVIEWFKNITQQRPSQLKFVKFDIVSFYPSITCNLLSRALSFTKSKVFMSDEDVEIVMQARKSFLYSKNSPWIKKNESNDLFDVPMGSYDGAEVCELVGLYLLQKIESSEIFLPNMFGLYRDDGLGFTTLKGREAEKLRQKLIKLFKDENLGITVDMNLSCTDFLDIKMDLNKGSYRPFRKPNDKPLYINKMSNHPPAIIKQLPKMVSSRLSTLSDSKEAFDEEKPMYEEALRQSGYEGIAMTYDPPKFGTKRRKRRVLYFNPPWNEAVATDIGRLFLRLICKHFPKGSKLHKYINLHNVKVSYSTTKNLKAHIASHNRKILRPEPEEDQRSCNCRSEKAKLSQLNRALKKPLDAQPPMWFNGQCPVDGNCLTKSVVYSASVSTDSTSMVYIGLTANTFKSRYDGHTKTFRDNKTEKTALSSHIAKLESKNEKYSVKWALKHKAAAYKPGASHCDLCLSEKVEILLADPTKSLNRRTEILETCRHKRKFKLGEVT